MSPSVTVIICTYNRPHLLPKALSSVLNQEWQDFDIILIDDGSDQAIETSLVDNSRIKLVRKDHGGIGSARAWGLREAQGQYIAYCDDDDKWLPDHLNLLMGYLHDNPHISLVYSRHYMD